LIGFSLGPTFEGTGFENKLKKKIQQELVEEMPTAE
jgi:hypothetical protein